MPVQRASAWGVHERFWTRTGLLRFERKESGGSGSPLEWVLGSELFIALPWRVPKLGKRFFEPTPLLANGLRLAISRLVVLYTALVTRRWSVSAQFISASSLIGA